MNNVELLAKKIFETHVDSLQRIDELTRKEIVRLGSKEYLYFIFTTFPQVFVIYHLASNRELWRDLNENDWMVMIQNTSENPIATYSLVSFLHKFTDVDAISIYKSSVGVPDDIKSRTLSYLLERPHLLELTKQEKIFLKKRNVQITK